MSTPEEMAQKRREVDAVRLKLEASSKQQRQWATQHMENAMVLRQLEDVGEDGGAIYKMMGGVLVKQEHVEAVGIDRRALFTRASRSHSFALFSGEQRPETYGVYQARGGEMRQAAAGAAGGGGEDHGGVIQCVVCRPMQCDVSCQPTEPTL